ncbi:MAG: pre-peptidase C-terminal domain-containing protein, partial [Burkholderiales bacterium]|nr:pre-peptidase C-terminal domain-containing protein [Burkholderiales bacterium]
MFAMPKSLAASKIKPSIVEKAIARIFGRAEQWAAARSLRARRKIQFESLEPRLLMSADFMPSAPAGTMVHQANQSDAFATPGSVVSQVLPLDAGQKVSVAFSTGDPDVQGNIRLYGPGGGAPLGEASAGAPGESVLLDSVLAGAAGDYTVELRNLNGAGDGGAFQAQYFLNATGEAESFSGMPANDERASAQDLAPSELLLPGGGLRYAAVGTAQAGSDDFFKLDLLAGESASFGLGARESGAGGELQLQLLDAAGNLITLGDRQAPNFDQSITGFVAPDTGAYYLRVNGAGGEDYTLLALRQAAMDREPDDQPGAAQALSPLESALGSLGRKSSAEIRVAVLGGGNTTGQLNDDSFFDFAATTVSASDIDTLGELEGYDAVVIGGSTSTADYSQVAGALRQWVEAGHGVVGTGWLAHYAGPNWGSWVPDIDAVIPINLNASSSYSYYYPTVTVTDSSHPVTQGVTSFSGNAYYAYVEWSYGGADPGAEVLGNTLGYPTIVAGDAGAGRSVFLGPVYSDSGWNTPMADRLLEQALAWVSFGGTELRDNYRVAAAEADALVIETATPGDGPGQPANDLDVRLELYDPAGALVASNDNGAADGRNARIDYLVPASAGGTYRVSVLRGSGSGDYTLEVSNATGSLPAALVVEGSSIDDGAALTLAPDSVTLSFSSNLAYSSAQAGDLTVNGVPANALEWVDGRTLRFDIAGLASGDGAYDIALAAGALADVGGASSQAYAQSFSVDTTGPSIVGGTLLDGDVIGLSDYYSFTIELSEAFATGYLDYGDFTLYDPLRDQNYYANSFYYDSEAHTATFEYWDLPEGNYELTLFGGDYAFRDLLGNPLAGDQQTVAFSIDAGATDLTATPFEPVPPAGSTIYSLAEPVTGALHETGDTDEFTVMLDAAAGALQTLSVRLLPGFTSADGGEGGAGFAASAGGLSGAGSFRGRIDVYDPTWNWIGGAEAPLAGMQAVLNSAPVSLEGEYRVQITSLDGAGVYGVELRLNSAFEEETSSLGDNDGQWAAQPLDAAFAPVGDVSRAAVSGRLPPDLSAYADFEGGLPGDWSTTSDNPGAFSGWEEGAGDGGTDGLAMRADAGGGPAVNEAFWSYYLGDPAIDDLYLTFGTQASDGAQPGLVAISADGSNWIPVFDGDSTGGNWYYYGVSLNRAAAEAGIDPDGGTIYVRLRQVTDGSDPLAARFFDDVNLSTQQQDWYRFDALTGETFSAVVCHDNPEFAQNLRIELYDPNWIRVALGSPDAVNTDQAIRDFVATMDGTHYVRVFAEPWNAGEAPGDYQLVLTRGAAFERERNDFAGQSQDIAQTNRVFADAGTVVRVAVLEDGSGYAWDAAQQLNDDTWADFDARLVSYWEIDSLEDLEQFDVVLIGDPGSRWALEPIAPALREWVESGGGIVGTGRLVYAAGSNDGTPLLDIDAIIPVDPTGSPNDVYYQTVDIDEGIDHPITAGVADFSTYQSHVAPLDPGAQSLATVYGYPAVVAGEPGSGRSVYLAPSYMGGDYYVREGDGDRLLEQALLWAADLGPDRYTVQVAAGDVVTVATATPGDGAYAPDSAPDLSIEVFDPDGLPVGSDEDSAPDGRNALFAFTAGKSGSYQVVVSSAGDLPGDYVLSVTGTTGAPAVFRVTQSDPGDGVPLPVYPDSYTVELSEQVLLTSVDPSDLTVDGAPAEWVQFVDGDTLEFGIGNANLGIEHIYDVQIAAGAISSLS